VIIDYCASEVMLIDRQGNSVTELAVANLMESGEIKRHIRKIIKTYRERRNLTMDLLASELSHVSSFTPPHGGLAIWLKINDDIRLSKVVDNALKEKVRILPASLFTESEEQINAIRLGFASLSPPELISGIKRLKSIVDRQ